MSMQCHLQFELITLARMSDMILMILLSSTQFVIWKYYRKMNSFCYLSAVVMNFCVV